MTPWPLDGPPGVVLDRLRRWWDAPDGPLVVRTSGSTGRPRAVVLGAAAVRASVLASHQRLGGPAAWVLALPVGVVAGLQVLARSVHAGAEPVLLDEHRGDWAAAAGAAARAAEVAGVARTATSLVPTQLHRLDRNGMLGALAAFDTVLVGGAAADPALLARARARGVPIVTTYGMAETCGGCVYDGVPLTDVLVRIADDDRILVNGPVLFDGYLDDPAATAAVLVDGWLRTGDVGRLDPTGRLQVVGRADDVVLSGGVGVALPAVEAAVRTHPDVADAAVVAVDDPEWGSRVVVAVIAAAGGTVTLSDVRDHVCAELPRTWAPRSLLVVDRLPLLTSGKVDRTAVRQLFQPHRPAPPSLRG
jgi:O-succinylbenzoic acid--CoA ligase